MRYPPMAMRGDLIVSAVELLCDYLAELDGQK